MTRVDVAGVLFVLLTVLLAGCGGSGVAGTPTPTALATPTDTKPDEATATPTAPASAPPTTDPAGTDPPAVTLDATVTERSYLQVTHAGGPPIPANESSFVVSWRFSGLTGGGNASTLHRSFEPGDSLYVYRDGAGHVSVSIGTEPTDPQPLAAVVTVSFTTDAGDVLATTEDVSVGLSPVEASLSLEPVNDRLVRVTHEGGDVLRAGTVDYYVDHQSGESGWITWATLESDFGPGDTAWIYYREDGDLAFTVGERPEDPAASLSGTVLFRLNGPTGEAFFSGEVTVDGDS